MTEDKTFGTVPVHPCHVCGKPAAFRGANGNLLCDDDAKRLNASHRPLDATGDLTQCCLPGVVAAQVEGIFHGEPVVDTQYVPVPLSQREAEHKGGECLPGGLNSLVNFGEFMAQVHAIVAHKGKDKGYSMGEAEERPGGKLMEFVEEHFKGHALGEIVYKAVRFQSKKNPEDLIKAAAWAYLVWANPFLKSPPAPPVQQGRSESADAVLAVVKREALNALKARPGVITADPVRLAALVAEEAGEALREALDATRASRTEVDAVLIQQLVTELYQTAAMATQAILVLTGRA